MDLGLRLNKLESKTKNLNLFEGENKKRRSLCSARELKSDF